MPNKQWHPAFVAAVKEALKDAPPGEVEVIPEVALSSKPLGVDILVVKKSDKIKLAHPMAGIFRRYNLFEYKSPVDYLEANDYDKGLAVSFLYKALNHSESTTLEGLTLSFVSSTHPRAMLAMLEKRGLEVRANHPVPGIYAVREAYFPVQMVVLDELEHPEASYMFAAFLTRREKRIEAGSLLLKKHLEEPDDKDLEQLAEFALENELVEFQAIEEVLYMAQQMPVEERQRIIDLFNRHPVTQEWGERLLEQGLQRGKLEGRLEGKLEGKLEETRIGILDFLESRFEQRPAGVVAALDTIQDLERLKKLRREVFKADTLQEALEAIAQAANGEGEQ